MSDFAQRFVSQESSQVRMETREDGKRVLSGYGIVFHREGNPGTEYAMGGGWFERIDRAATDRIFAESNDVQITFNHSRDKLLGRTSSGTAKLSRDEYGVKYEVELPPNSVGNDVAVWAERKDIPGSSFTFRERSYKQDRSNESHKVWTVTDMDVPEMGPVTDPAYKATTASLRMSEERTAKLAEIESQERALRVSAIKASIRARTL